MPLLRLLYLDEFWANMTNVLTAILDDASVHPALVDAVLVRAEMQLIDDPR